jgi:hypothetical protein
VRRVGTCITVVALAGTAHADAGTAKQLVAEAEALVASGDLIGAAAKFRAAYKEEPVPEHICNAGVAYHRAQDLPRSHRYLNQCVTMGSSLDASYRDSLRKVIDALEAKLVVGDFTPIDLSLDPVAAIAAFEGGKPYDDEIVGGGRIWVPYGSYRLVVRAAGYLDKPVDVAASSDVAVPLRITLDRKPPDAPVVAPPPLPPQPPERVLVDAPRPSKLPAMLATGAAVLFGAASLWFYADAYDLVGQAEDAMTRDEFDRLHDSAHDSQRNALIFGGLAGAAAAVAAWRWWHALRDPGQIEVTVSGSGVAVQGRF